MFLYCTVSPHNHGLCLIHPCIIRGHFRICHRKGTEMELPDITQFEEKYKWLRVYSQRVCFMCYVL